MDGGVVVRLLSFALLSLFVGTGCSSKNNGTTETHGDPSTDVDAGGDAGQQHCPSDGCPLGDGDGHGDGDGDSHPADKDGGMFAECATSRTEAERTLRPVDIVWVVDSSGSMKDEAKAIQDNINTFASKIASAGIPNYRVVMITEKKFLSVPDPLGSDAAHFQFLDQVVDSHDALQVLLDKADEYQGFLQEKSLLHVVVVTDDESNPLQAADFISQYKAKLGREDFKLHAVASEKVHTCDPITGLFCLDLACSSGSNSAAAPGVVYYDAAMMTGGLTFSICTMDWGGLFDELAKAVSTSAPIPCELLVPDPPEGETLDPGKVNVLFTAPDASEGVTFPGVASQEACGDKPGWYYDAPADPKKILLCPAACTSAEGGGSLDIALGCATVVVQ